MPIFDFRPDDLPHPRQRIALAVVIALRDHGAVHEEEDDVDRHRRREVGEQRVAQLLVDMAQGDPGRLGEGGEAFGDAVAVPLAHGAPFDQRDIAEARRPAAAVVPEILALEECRPAGGDRREGVGLGGERRDEDVHVCLLPVVYVSPPPAPGTASPASPSPSRISRAASGSKRARSPMRTRRHPVSPE